MENKKRKWLAGSHERLKISTTERAELFDMPEPTWRTWRSGYRQPDGRYKIDFGRLLMFYAIDELTPEQIASAKKRAAELIEKYGVDSEGLYTPADELYATGADNGNPIS